MLLRSFVYGAYVDDPVVMIVPDGETNDVYFFAKGRQFSITALIDYSGSVVEFYEYSAFGLMKVREPDWTERTGGTAYGNQYGFTGRRWDAESELWHYRNRAYAPWLGRFLQRDPSGFTDGVNLYACVANNPLRFLDPTGRTMRSSTYTDSSLSPWQNETMSIIDSGMREAEQPQSSCAPRQLSRLGILDTPGGRGYNSQIYCLAQVGAQYETR